MTEIHWANSIISVKDQLSLPELINALKKSKILRDAVIEEFCKRSSIPGIAIVSNVKQD